MKVKKITKNVKIPLASPKPVENEENLVWSQHQTNKFLLEREKEMFTYGQKVDDMGRPWSYHEEFKTNEQQRFMNNVEEIKKVIHVGSYQKKDLFVDKSSDEVYDYSEFWNNILRNKMEYNDTIFNSFHVQKFKGRFMKYRTAGQPSMAFSGHLQNPWFVKYVYLKKFEDAVNTICIQNRMLKRLRILKNLTAEDIKQIEEEVILLDD